LLLPPRRNICESGFNPGTGAELEELEAVVIRCAVYVVPTDVPEVWRGPRWSCSLRLMTPAASTVELEFWGEGLPLCRGSASALAGPVGLLDVVLLAAKIIVLLFVATVASGAHIVLIFISSLSLFVFLPPDVVRVATASCDGRCPRPSSDDVGEAVL